MESLIARHHEYEISRYELERRAVNQDAIRAYEEELLPSILPGEWITSIRKARDLYDDLESLFDHATLFRRYGAKGPISWKICAIVAHPYHALDHEGRVTCRTRSSTIIVESAWGWRLGAIRSLVMVPWSLAIGRRGRRSTA